ncbi:MAG: cupin domain-containing protein [bacterium]
MQRSHLVLVLGMSSLIAACAGGPFERSAGNPPSPEPAVLAAGEGEKLRFRDGRSVLLKVTREGTGAQDLLLGSETLPPGTAIPVHSHDGYEEIIFIHEGNAELTLGERTIRAEPGTTMYIPPGTWHGVKNADSGRTTMLFIFPETDIADFFRSVGQHEGKEPPQLTAEDWAEIMKRHQMRSPSD